MLRARTLLSAHTRLRTAAIALIVVAGVLAASLAVAATARFYAAEPLLVPPAVAVDDTVSQSLAQFVANDGVAGDEFGYSMAVSGDTAVVGARTATIGPEAGAGASGLSSRS
jgi:hypothetical protein